MPSTIPQISQLGTHVSETIDGTEATDVVLGLSGDDTITSSGGDDTVYGDFYQGNLLSGTDNATSFAQYADSGSWDVAAEAGGHTSMTQNIQTQPGETYAIRFDLAANYGAQSLSGAIEVLWNGEVIDSFDTNSAMFSPHSINFTGDGGPGALTFRSIDITNTSGPDIISDGPIYYYNTQKHIDGQTVNVKAFAEGQVNIYQVLNGTLQVFDPITEQYTQAGSDATVTVNAIGFNVEDNLIYGVAVSNGRDSLGNAVAQSDLVMMDAQGDSFLIGSTPYRSWTGDFDSSGNLWTFQSSMNQITMIDVDRVDANGTVATQTFKFPKSMVTDQLWDVAYDTVSQSFFGVTRPGSQGTSSTLYQIDVSEVPSGGVPIFSTLPITGTMIDGELLTGLPAITFGAAIHDADGNLYVGGNSGDHDMNGTTANAGGIYKVIRDLDTGTAYLELVSNSPRSYSNDGAADPRAMDPFAQIDVSASVLIRNLDLELVPDASETYDDTITNGSGADHSDGGIGKDTIAGQSGNDTLLGGDGDDALFGGNSNQNSPALTFIYDADGNRYDLEGNLMPQEDDNLDGGAGNDILHGGSGHDFLAGGIGNDDLNGGSGFDTLYGGEGDDQLASGAQNDVLYGGAGSDELVGGDGDDILNGDDGQDNLKGGAGADTLDGGTGDDILNGGIGNDILIGGTGNDQLFGSTGNDVLSAAFGNNSLDGGSGHDVLTGGNGIDQMIGGSGNDVLLGEGGRDILKGGTGNDTLEGGADKDKLYGGSGNDLIDGGSGSDYINAGSGDDTVDAGAGRDKILMGAGADVVRGGAETDWFAFTFSDADGKTNTLLDFTHNGTENDRLDFRKFDLLNDGTTQTDWFDAHVTQNADFSVRIEFGSISVELIDHAGIQGQFLSQVLDGFQL